MRSSPVAAVGWRVRGVVSGGTRVSWLGWGGAELAVGAAGQLPAALVDGPMVGPAEQGEVVQVVGPPLIQCHR